MEKKLTAQGPPGRISYTVTLPLDWVRQQGLHQSKKVELQVLGRKVIIVPDKDLPLREVIDLKDYPSTLIKVLPGLYRLGIDEVKIVYHTPAQVQEIIAIVNTKLIGYEIIEHTTEYVLIKDITTESSEDFDTVLRRVFLLLLELTAATAPAQITALDQNLKKLVNYGERILIKKGHLDYVRTPFYLLLLDRLEKLTDEYTWILEFPSTAKNKHFKEINEYVRKAYELYYSFSSLKADAGGWKTFQWSQALRKRPAATVVELHLHNLARQLNSLYGIIFILRHRQTRD